RSGDYRRFEVCTYPLIGPNGNLERVFGIGRDLTEYFIHMDRRKDAESEARALFAAMDGVVLILSRDGHIMRVLSVPESLLPWRGDTENQIGGVKIEDVLSPFLAAGHTDRIEAALAAGKLVRYEIEYPLGGEKRWYSAAYSPLDDDRVLLVADDITERKRAEQQALALALTQERTGILERLVADVSHDLRHPISVLRSASIVMDQYVGQALRQVTELYEHAMAGRSGLIRNQVVGFGQILAEMREQIVRLDNSLQRIQSSVEARLYEVRAERGVGFEFNPLSVNQLIEQAVSVRRADATRRGQRLALHLDADLPLVRLDVGEFSRALRALIGRALQDAPDHATVNVSTRRDDGLVILEVAGPVSADPRELTRLADPAYRAMRLGDQWQSSHDLTIAHRIVVAHGGKVGQETRPGGVRVWQVWLPI
ncbi:MAG: PAS domain-containing protein, partial [Anaerolineae bacterium]|nr:PAS domain-containing protein [Anaerolineae bacterium]